jgi:predicted porin
MFAKKTGVAVALLTLATAAHADPVSVYGKINVSVQQSDKGAGSYSELKSNASRFGLKGDQALDAGLTLVYQLEWEVDPSDEANEKNIKARNQFVGLKGDFGTIKFGRHDTALKEAQGKIDLYNDYEADLKTLWKGENRMSNSVTYVSPKFAGHFAVELSNVMKDTPTGQSGQSVALMYGDENLKDTKVFATAALDNDVNGYDAKRVMAQFKVSGFKLGAGVHQQEDIVKAVKGDGYLANVAYPIDKIELKAQYQTLEDDKGYSLGADYKLGKDTKLFAWYSTYNFETKDDTKYIAFGLEHKF